MSFLPFTGTGGGIQANTVDRVLATATLNTQISTDQIVYTCPANTTITQLIFDLPSISLLIAVCEAGFNAGADDVNPAIVLAALVTSGVYSIALPISGAAVGTTGQTLKIRFTTPTIGAGTVRVRVYGITG